ncbi:MAG: acetylglutamate kinase [Spirochaetota bacterium]
MANSSILIKLGGTAATNAAQLEMLARELPALPGPIAIVHGGGKEVSDVSRRFGLEPVFHEGIRMTTEDEMDVVEMILCGLANKRLVRRLLRAGVNAVGISGADGGMVTGGRIADARGAPSRTAKVAATNPFLVRDLWVCGYVPVIASPASDATGEAVNINADDIAFSLAGAMGVGSLLFLSDVAGVLIDGEPVSSLTPAMASAQIAAGEISGGMIPKVQNAMTAIETGVAQVVIGSYEHRGDLSALLEGRRGTAIVPGDET